MRYQGRLSGWNDDKGFGFVVPNGSGDRAFVHIKAFPRASRRPLDGDLITYTVARDARGRLQANAIRFVGEAMPVDDRTTPGWLGPTFALIFVATLVGMHLGGHLPTIVLTAYAAMGFIAFVAYGLDKSAATAGRQRTPETTLHLLGLFGGWPGALLAQRWFRHKSRKTSFQRMYWATVALNLCALAWLSTAEGRALIDRFVAMP